MPTLNEQLHKLSSAKCFPLVDVKGFLHIPLDEETSSITTMHTSYSKYRLLGLPFDITSAPDEFTRLTSALEGSILVYGEGNKFEDAQADHDRRFIPSMERCHQKSIKIKVGKLCFKLKEVKLIGTIISDNRMKT